MTPGNEEDPEEALPVCALRVTAPRHGHMRRVAHPWHGLRAVVHRRYQHRRQRRYLRLYQEGPLRRRRRRCHCLRRGHHWKETDPSH